MSRVLIVGAGVAGTAAAWACARAGATVTVVDGGPGSSLLYSGAVDAVAWEDRPDDAPVDADVIAFSTALGSWRLGPSSCRVATRAGVLRPARGADEAVLDLVPLAGRNVAVADLARDGWDAPILARSFDESEWARRTRTRFTAVPLDLAPEPHVPDLDFAGMLGEDSFQNLATAMARAGKQDAWLFGPFIAAGSDAVSRIQTMTGAIVGESLSGPGGAAGARLERARDHLLDDLGVRRVAGRVRSVCEASGGWRATVRGGDAEEADAVVLALGGVAAGGVSVGSYGAPAFALSLDAPVLLELDGRRFDGVCAPAGLALDRAGLGVLERIGISVGANTSCGPRGLHAAGDAVASEQRTVLAAVRQGIAAGRSAISA